MKKLILIGLLLIGVLLVGCAGQENVPEDLRVPEGTLAGQAIYLKANAKMLAEGLNLDLGINTLVWPYDLKETKITEGLASLLKSIKYVKGEKEKTYFFPEGSPDAKKYPLLNKLTTLKPKQKYYIYLTGKAELIYPLPATPSIARCGNGVINYGEDCSNCPADIQCASGTICQDGVCVICTDSDGYSLTTYGTISFSNGTVLNDYCFSTPTGSMVVEGVCDVSGGNYLKYKWVDCPTGTTCRDGACVTCTPITATCNQEGVSCPGKVPVPKIACPTGTTCQNGVCATTPTQFCYYIDTNGVQKPAGWRYYDFSWPYTYFGINASNVIYENVCNEVDLYKEKCGTPWEWRSGDYAARGYPEPSCPGGYGCKNKRCCQSDVARTYSECQAEFSVNYTYTDCNWPNEPFVNKTNCTKDFWTGARVNKTCYFSPPATLNINASCYKCNQSICEKTVTDGYNTAGTKKVLEEYYYTNCASLWPQGTWRETGEVVTGPGCPELCDSKDNNANGQVDEGC